MSNKDIRRYARLNVRSNYWTVILVSLLAMVVIGTLSSFFEPSIDSLLVLESVREGTFDSTMQAVGESASIRLIFLNLCSLLMPFFTVGISYWMALCLSDVGKYSLAEWFGAYGRNTGPALLNVFVYNLLSLLLKVVINAIMFLILFTIGTLFAASLQQVYPTYFEGYHLVILAVTIIALIVTFLASYPLSFLVDYYFSMPYFIVYDFTGIAFKDVWKMNRILIKDKFWQAFRLRIWYVLVGTGAVILYGLLGVLIGMGVASSSDTVTDTAMIVIIYFAIALLSLLFLVVPFVTEQQTSWATFYRELMKEKQDELEENFPHIDFGRLFQQGMDSAGD